MERNRLLERAEREEDRLLLAKVLDRQAQTDRRSIPVCTDFLSPRERLMAEDVLRMAGVSGDHYAVSGGYEGAERQAILFLPDWQTRDTAEFPFRFLRASYRPEYDLSHRDFLGSLMGMGIAREKTGDFLVGKQSCDLIVADSIADFLLQNWNQTGRAALRVIEITADKLCVPEIRCEEIRDTVQSLRLDAVAAGGFHMSRGKAAALIESGHMTLNWQECVKPDHILREGDTISARGFGKIQLAQVGGVTRKGRTGIVLKRYL